MQTFELTLNFQTFELNRSIIEGSNALIHNPGTPESDATLRETVKVSTQGPYFVALKMFYFTSPYSVALKIFVVVVVAAAFHETLPEASHHSWMRKPG